METKHQELIKIMRKAMIEATSKNLFDQPVEVYIKCPSPQRYIELELVLTKDDVKVTRSREVEIFCEDKT